MPTEMVDAEPLLLLLPAPLLVLLPPLEQAASASAASAATAVSGRQRAPWVLSKVSP
jgi:hypothetical protein